jgi:aminotransferase EvaB
MRYLGYEPGSLPETERAAAENLALPMWGGLDADRQEEVVAAVRAAVGAPVRA